MPAATSRVTAIGVLRDATLRSIGTSACLNGTTDCDVEAIKGFGVLRAQQRTGVPAIEVRALRECMADA